MLLCFDIVFLSNSYVSAFEFGVSPSELNFQGKEGEKICKNVKIFSSIDGINIAIEDKWTTQKDSSKNLNEYLMDSNELKINMNYERDFLLNNEREIKKFNHKHVIHEFVELFLKGTVKDGEWRQQHD